jgi:hypothetical protein
VFNKLQSRADFLNSCTKGILDKVSTYITVISTYQSS